MWLSETIKSKIVTNKNPISPALVPLLPSTANDPRSLFGTRNSGSSDTCSRIRMERCYEYAAKVALLTSRTYGDVWAQPCFTTSRGPVLNLVNICLHPLKSFLVYPNHWRRHEIFPNRRGRPDSSAHCSWILIRRDLVSRPLPFSLAQILKLDSVLCVLSQLFGRQACWGRGGGGGGGGGGAAVAPGPPAPIPPPPCQPG